MPKKKTILVSGASGIVGYGILRSLLRERENYVLIGTTIYSNSIAPVFSNIFELAPPTNSEGYIDWLLSTIIKHKVDMIIPSIEADMYSWNKHRVEILNAGAVPLLNNKNLIDLCEDKWVFYNELKDLIPDYIIKTTDNLSKNNFGFPYILKPKKGFGSKGIIRINNQEDYINNKNKITSELIMQPIVGDDDAEFTVSAFFDKDYKLIDYLALKRSLSLSGFTEIAEVVNNDFTEVLTDIGKIVNPIGPTNFQFRLENGAFKLLEINPRISSATSIRAAFGYNESKMSVDYFIDKIMPIKIKKEDILNRKAIRYVEDYIL